MRLRSHAIQVSRSRRNREDSKEDCGLEVRVSAQYPYGRRTDLRTNRSVARTKTTNSTTSSEHRLEQ